MPGPSKWSLSFEFPHQTPVCTYPLSHSAKSSGHLILDLITRIIGEEYRSLIGPGNAVSIATGYGLNGPGTESR